MLKIKKLRSNAVLPLRATAGSAGHDLTACIEQDLTLQPNTPVLIPTGIAIQLESDGYVPLYMGAAD
jgi:dUTP pyrophosphatase